MRRLLSARKRSAWAGLSAMVFGVVLLAAAAAAQSNTVQSIQYGTVMAADPVTIQDRPSGRGARTGSTVGAVAGAAIAKRGDRWFGALVGGVAGGAIGRAGDRAGSVKQGTELIIKLEKSGEEVAIQLPGKLELQPGDRVRLTSGPNGTRVARAPVGNPSEPDR